ncbi:hypothetical protein CKAH01_05121 [Colletotrichum kahawae]|uniref:Uncharacterized protein n=1 Tax=Colletotrichum kahawae TaxID=34407 RepID=A0AAD9YH91_COLKA|nr:hypothetical protein CKAH01_05121 [Colletotrichum kahawae]
MAPKRKRKATAKTGMAKSATTLQAPNDPAATSCSTENGAANNYLQILPAEIRLMIYSLAVVQDQPIRPAQIEDRSNKFKTAPLQPKSRQQAVRTFTSLLLTSRFFYDEVLAHPFFYRFAFPSVTSLHVFLSALTPARRASLCQIRLGIISWWGVCLHGDKAVSLAADMLCHCTSLRSLKVDIGITTGILYPTPATWFANRRQSGPTSSIPVSGRRLTEVLAASRLDFYGEDRVRQDLQAGMVSSRTRGRMKRLESAGSNAVSNGVIPSVDTNPKYLEVDESQGEGDQWARLAKLEATAPWGTPPASSTVLEHLPRSKVFRIAYCEVTRKQ